MGALASEAASAASAETADVAIIGGGVIGLSIAFHLLQAAPGLRVAIIDAGAVSGGDRGQASYAAAGMLAPFAEAHGAGPFVRLGVESLNRYPAFVEAVRDAAGPDGDPQLAITGPGMLRIAQTPEEAHRLDALFAWQHKSAWGIERLTGDEARALEPNLDDVLLALHSPHERQIDPRRLTRTLRAACLKMGATLHYHSALTKMTCRGDDYVIEAAGTASIRAQTLVIAGGAWSRAAACGLGVTLPVAPVKGQILALRAPRLIVPSKPFALRHTIYAPNVYLVPRPEGRIIVGATEEPDAGFDMQVTAETWSPLLDVARNLVPALREAPFDGWPWAGFRPASPDGLPILGPLPDQPNAFVATGHFRNGILLAPITGEIIAQQILHLAQPHPLLDAAFRPERFAL